MSKTKTIALSDDLHGEVMLLKLKMKAWDAEAVIKLAIQSLKKAERGLRLKNGIKARNNPSGKR